MSALWLVRVAVAATMLVLPFPGGSVTHPSLTGSLAIVSAQTTEPASPQDVDGEDEPLVVDEDVNDQGNGNEKENGSESQNGSSR